MGGPSRETLTGHQSDFSSPPTKGKASSVAPSTGNYDRTKNTCCRNDAQVPRRKPADNLRLGLTIVESLQ